MKMKNLPVEILRNIFTLLYQEDQLECILTCRLWKNIIEEFCLFNTLHVYSYTFLEKVSKKIQEQPRLRKNIHQINLHLCDIEEVNLTTFLEEFPNIQYFRTIGPSFGDLYIDNWSTIPWYKHIGFIEEDTTQSIAYQLLSSGVCSNLTVLGISNEDNVIIPLLKNAPALKELALDAYKITLDEIDKVHENLPHLETFKIAHATINVENLKKNIIPANSVTKLYFPSTRISTLERNVRFLSFITRKYPNLVELEYATYYCPVKVSQDDHLYKNGWIPLLQTIGPQLKKLYTSHSDQFQNLLLTLDKHNCKIQHMKIHKTIPNFVQSQQILYIRTLVLSEIHFDSIEWLKELKILESLDILTGRDQKPLHLNFNDIVNNSPPTLKALTVRNVFLATDLLSDRQCNIKDLVFFECDLSSTLTEFFDRHFPLIANLKIKNCKNLLSNITLKSAKMESFCFIESNRGKPIYILVKTIYDNKERFYFTRKEEYYYQYSAYYRTLDDPYYPPIQSQPAGNVKVVPDLTLCCFSIKDIILCR